MPRLRDPRTILVLALVLSWLAMLFLMWRAFWTPPPPELLAQERMVRPPTMSLLWLHAGLSAAELLALALLLWPGRVYGARLVAAVIGLVVYFVMTTPLAINSVEQVHRRWLALVAVVLLLALAAVLVRATWRALGRRAAA